MALLLLGKEIINLENSVQKSLNKKQVWKQRKRNTTCLIYYVMKKDYLNKKKIWSKKSKTKFKIRSQKTTDNLMKQQGQQQHKVQNNRQNYHQQQQKNETGSDSSNSIRRYSLSSTWTSSSSRTNSKNKSKSRSNSSKRNTHNLIKKVHNRIKTPQNHKEKGVCKFWMKGTCNKFDSCKNKLYQQTTLCLRKKITLNQNQVINEALLKENKILVTTITQKLINSQQLIELISQDYDGLNQITKISHKNNKQKQIMKKLLYKNQKNEYLNKTQRENEKLLIIKKFIPILIKDTKDENSHKIIIAKQRRLEEKKNLLAIKEEYQLEQDAFLILEKQNY